MMNAFGGIRQEPMMTDMVDDEYDVMNDETFGGDIPNEEWEGEHGDGQLESEKPAGVFEHSTDLLDFAASKLPVINNNDDPLDFLEQSISHLVEDDDDVVIIRKRSGATAEPITDIFTTGSPQNPFFQLDKANIWSDSPSAAIVKSKRPPSSSSTTTDTQAALSGLIYKMQINNGNNNNAAAAPIPIPGPGPVLVRGAKTAEELEAELLGKQPTVVGGTATQQNTAAAAVGPSLPPLPTPSMKSCQELERELIEGSRAAAGAMGAGDLKGAELGPAAITTTAQLPPQGGIPPGLLLPQPPAPQGAANPLLAQQQQPPPPHLMLANPQVRALLMARWMAANPGAVPPIWLRLPPPPIMPPPRPGFPPHPSMIRAAGPPNNNMPPAAHMNFHQHHPNMRMAAAQGMVPRGVGVTIHQQAGGPRRSSPSFPKRRLFDSPGRQHRHQNEDTSYGGGEDSRRRGAASSDPFAGLMTRRERSWLMKIQSLQLHSDNPYVDDYYWMMYRRRKMTGDGNSVLSTDGGHNIEHRTYVPPSFEGSLGKVQVLSANFPRQLLDLAAAAPAPTTNGDANSASNPRSSVDSGSPIESPAKFLTINQQPANTRRLKHILIELENLYIMLLEVNDMTIMQETAARDGHGQDSGESRERAARMKHLIQCIVSSLITDNHVISALSIRKGRRLLLQLMPYCERDQRLQLAESVMKNLLPLSKKELSNEILATLKLLFSSKLTGLSEHEWSQLWLAADADVVEAAMKNKMGVLVMLEIVQCSAVDNAILDASATKPIERWSSVMYTNITSSSSSGGGGKSGAQQQAASMDKEHVDSMCEWLDKLTGTPIPPSVVQTIRAYLLGEKTAEESLIARAPVK